MNSTRIRRLIIAAAALAALHGVPAMNPAAPEQGPLPRPIRLGEPGAPAPAAPPSMTDPVELHSAAITPAETSFNRPRSVGGAQRLHFGSPVSLATGTSARSVGSLLVADFDRDGRPDLVTAAA